MLNKFIAMVTILKDNKKLTPYLFYSKLLKEIANEIQKSDDLKYKLFENGDDKIFDSVYSIEPITIPLLLSLTEQLSKYYKKPIDLLLYNNQATKNVLKFLYSSDFFNVSGNNQNPIFPIGRKILNFDERYIGDFIGKKHRPEHKVRCYSLNDNNFNTELEAYKTDDDKRDFLISKYIYLVRAHFQELLFDNDNTIHKVDLYIEILSELITNGVLHSKSDTFALMFVNKYATKFSISDNGIGFTESLKNKREDDIYKPLDLLYSLSQIKSLDINYKVLENLNFIFETLYYSSLKNRKGLFDLMISVVLKSNGYFRLHSENSQIIISSRMTKELLVLSDLRSKLINLHRFNLINGITRDSKSEIEIIKDSLKVNFIELYRSVCNKYNEDFRYSSLRFFNVKFRGVHIEVEIPTQEI